MCVCVQEGGQKDEVEQYLDQSPMHNCMHMHVQYMITSDIQEWLSLLAAKEASLPPFLAEVCALCL